MEVQKKKMRSKKEPEKAKRSFVQDDPIDEQVNKVSKQHF